ncbi:peptide ABC transporter ATP-binding protein [Saccharothrix sp. NRRL B-16348]|uniref:ABC transporter ATP-binding protein n=1 Tax=Saccharothrix sp. NRRL B-16348 TaxID=1415542 RepID=UPI0006AEEB8F|nr:ABC transporter ATP-binding protein [Saccharothrix sp. NRRL B-16348]KOX16038.1 peptide ABC transporter ATP-binding protein [Saccharothrix sp. NRRL B-16348]
MSGRALLEVEGLRITATRPHEVDLVRDLSFAVAAGEMLAVVGESGAGKSVTARAVLGLLPAGLRVSGHVRFDGRELVGGTGAAHRALWGRRMAFVPQDALSVLSPVHTVGDQLALAVRSVRGVGRKAALEQAVAALDRVGIPDAARRARAYPHEFSGGMRQRAVIAMATVNDPDLVVADEPTTALDPTVQARILDMLAAFREQAGMAVVLVTHDLAVAAAHADRVLVMYAGRHVESGPVHRVLRAPRAPYTAGLIASLPARHAVSRYLPAMSGAPATAGALPPGCAFAPRCPAATDSCTRHEPEPVEWHDGHWASCHRIAELPRRTADLFERTGT